MNDNSRRRLPPYISYRSFWNFIDRLKEGIPARIDRSYLSDRFAGSTGTQLMSALRFLDLMEDDGAPTTRLRLLVSAKDANRKEALKQVSSESFDFLLQGNFDLQTSTYSQLKEAFHNTFELTDDVCRKCIKFFISLASDAEMDLSPFITQRLKSTHATGTTKRITKTGIKKSADRGNSGTNQNSVIPQPSEEIPAGLLAKFPTFDPAWSDEVKLSWFKAFDELLRRNSPTNEKH